MTVQVGGAVLVLAAAVLGLWRYGVQRRQRRTLVWALAAAIGEMESAIRWQQTPMMALLEGLAARETVGQYFHETATWCKVELLYSAHGKRLFLRYRTERPGRYWRGCGWAETESGWWARWGRHGRSWRSCTGGDAGRTDRGAG